MQSGKGWGNTSNKAKEGNSTTLEGRGSYHLPPLSRMEMSRLRYIQTHNKSTKGRTRLPSLF